METCLRHVTGYIDRRGHKPQARAVRGWPRSRTRIHELARTIDAAKPTLCQPKS